MYYRKGTDQHLTFLRNMREAHAMYPFTGKRDKELFDKALAELFFRMPILTLEPLRTTNYLYISSMSRRTTQLSRKKKCKSCVSSIGVGEGVVKHDIKGNIPG
uniref:Uncharacterized protein n=1 Tax=Biomphalaria glabrata TaxID=6526 RepID=A0A2C9LPZ9_BIOGL